MFQRNCKNPAGPFFFNIKCNGALLAPFSFTAPPHPRLSLSLSLSLFLLLLLLLLLLLCCCRTTVDPASAAHVAPLSTGRRSVSMSTL